MIYVNIDHRICRSMNMKMKMKMKMVEQVEIYYDYLNMIIIYVIN